MVQPSVHRPSAGFGHFMLALGLVAVAAGAAWFLWVQGPLTITQMGHSTYANSRLVCCPSSWSVSELAAHLQA